MAKILVVDDSEEALELYSAFLGAEHEVLTATDWVSANAAFRADVDLVLLDINMPTLGGEELARIMLRVDPDLRIVLASGIDETELRQRAKAVGAAGYFPKVFDANLPRKVARYLR